LTPRPLSCVCGRGTRADFFRSTFDASFENFKDLYPEEYAMVFRDDDADTVHFGYTIPPTDVMRRVPIMKAPFLGLPWAECGEAITLRHCLARKRRGRGKDTVAQAAPWTQRQAGPQVVGQAQGRVVQAVRDVRAAELGHQADPRAEPAPRQDARGSFRSCSLFCCRWAGVVEGR